MSSTTYKSTAKTFNYKTATNKASPKIAYKITAKRSSNTSTKVTLKLDFSIGWNISKQGSVIKDPFEMEVTIGTQTKLSVSVNIPKCTGASGTLYDRDNTTAYNVATGSKSVEITWTSGNSLSVSGTCSQSYIGETINFSGGSISMPTYSSSSGGGGGGGDTTVGANSVTSLSVSPITTTPNSELNFTIKASKGSNNSISGYKIMLGTKVVGTSTSTSTSASIKINAPSTAGTYTYTAYVNSSSTGWSKTTKTTNVTIKYETPTITNAYIEPTKVSSSDGGEVRLYATTNTKRFVYYINNVYQTPDYLYRDIRVEANDIIKVYGYNPDSGEVSNNYKTITVGSYTPVKISSISINPIILKDNPSSYDLVNIINRGSISYTGPNSSIKWYYRQSSTSTGLSNSSWTELGINSSSFSNLNMTEKVSKGYYYQFKAVIIGDYNSDEKISPEIYQIPKEPSGPTFTKIIAKADPSKGYTEIVQDDKKFYGSGLFILWTNPTILDSQLPISEIEMIYQSKSQSATIYDEIKTAQFQYHKLLDNEIEYEYSNNVPYTAIKPSGATGSGGGADLSVDSLYETRIGIRITDVLGQYTDTWYTAETFIKAQAPDFGGNLTLNISEFRPFTCDVNGKMHFTSSIARSAAQDKLFYFIDCYINERRATIKILDSIPISTLEMDTQSTGYILYQDDNIIVKKENGTTIAYEINNEYFKNKLLAETKLKSSKEGENIYFNDDFNEVVYQIYVKDNFDASTRHYNTENKSIKFIEAPTLSNNSYLDIGVNRYVKSQNPFYDNSIVLLNSSSKNNDRMINPGESIIFKFKRAQDYNGADYSSTMLGDVTQYNIYVSRNDSIVTSNYENLTYTLLKSFSASSDLKKAYPNDSTDEYYYLEYPLTNYMESKFVVFKIEAIDSKSQKSDFLYSNTYIVPCRASSMDFYLSNIKLSETLTGYDLTFKSKVNDFGASFFTNNLYGYDKTNENYSFPNYERSFTVNSNTFSRKGYLIFEGCLDGDFSNNGTTIIKSTGENNTEIDNLYNNYFSQTIDLTSFLTNENCYTDIIENTYPASDFPAEWQTGIKNSIIKKIFFRLTYKIAYGFSDIESDTFDTRYLFVSSTCAPYSYYEDAPTVSYRNHQVGINTKDFSVDSKGGQKEVLIIQDNGSYNLVVFKGAEQKIILNLTERTFYTEDNSGKVLTEINFNTQYINGMTIDSGEW